MIKKLYSQVLLVIVIFGAYLSDERIIMAMKDVEDKNILLVKDFLTFKMNEQRNFIINATSGNGPNFV